MNSGIFNSHKKTQRLCAFLYFLCGYAFLPQRTAAKIPAAAERLMNFFLSLLSENQVMKGKLLSILIFGLGVSLCEGQSWVEIYNVMGQKVAVATLKKV